MAKKQKKISDKQKIKTLTQNYESQKERAELVISEFGQFKGKIRDALGGLSYAFDENNLLSQIGDLYKFKLDYEGSRDVRIKLLEEQLFWLRDLVRQLTGDPVRLEREKYYLELEKQGKNRCDRPGNIW